ncbi:MAG: UDP-N-acetylmuramate:L-alanyl-gamma-D-glutamyl-meso-diaminopimelate ligase [Desulfatiglans sp.]|jgi:UDP-N-acetylmuramate: L-alanyl-gamma-D-glutamyl-meso-diaminopimelate ligase|nr:UDP-N-acetylmuramate:L-alanyl-gamma-D-glutamyl-meso-diaminopimelate ligase [Desulfatiglans sp.]
MEQIKNISDAKSGLKAALNRVPERLEHIHLMGICGTAMASLAGIFKVKGYHVTGSDQNVYPPMSTMLMDMGIEIKKGYSGENLSPRPDLVIVGNVITRNNPEAMRLSEMDVNYLSLPQALNAFAIQGRRSVVIAGTHGKTTTTALAAWLLEETDIEPGFMVGGILKNFGSSFRLGRGDYFVVEGDEYDTAFFDKGPKFLHYSPLITIITSIEFDHADIYRDLDHVISSFRRLIEIIPSHGLLIANLDDPIVNEEAKRARCRVITYGYNEAAMFRAVDISDEEDGTHVKILKDGKDYVNLISPLYGRHNISNTLSVIALTDHIGIKPIKLPAAIASFSGVKRRQEIRGEKNGILVLDDFAHHPTAVEKTIEAVKEKYMGRRIIAVFEPRSNSSRRGVFQEMYSRAFDKADMVFIPEPPLMEKVPIDNRFSSQGLVEAMKKRGINAFYGENTDRLIELILSNTGKGDVILIMSNGAFDNIHDRVLKKI